MYTEISCLIIEGLISLGTSLRKSSRNDCDASHAYFIQVLKNIEAESEPLFSFRE